MRPKTSGNTCARPISPTACSKTTPQSSTLVSSHGVAFSTNSAASHPLPAAIGPPWVNQFEVWYYTFAQARFSEALPDWIGAHVDALAFLGGVPKALVCDNLKAGVTAASRYEPRVNPTYQ